MNTITDTFERADNLLQQIEPLTARTLEGGQGTITELRAKVTASRINVMLLGAYNAGKSTLINTLLGEARAVVGDIPTTDRVDCYDWHGHALWDTPGVNAPIEHEQISTAALDHADLVLLVMRQEDQDAQDLHDRLFQLLQRKRHVFLVLNHELASADDAEPLRTRLIDVMLQQAQRRGLPSEVIQRVPFVLVNLRMALNARLAGKALLLRVSGYEEFAMRFNQWLQRFDDEHKRLQFIQDAVVRQLLEPLRAALAQDPTENSQLFDLVQQIAHIERETTNHVHAVAGHIRARIAAVRPRIAAAFDDSADAERLNNAIHDIVCKIGEDTARWLEAELGTTAPSDGLEATATSTSFAASFSEGKKSDLAKRLTKEGLHGLKHVGAEEISKLLHLGRKLKLPPLKGRWSRTLDKWAGKAAPILQIAVSLAEAGVAAREENDQNREARAASVQRHQWIEEIVADLQSTLQERASDYVRAATSQRLAPLEARRMELLASAQRSAQDIDAVELFARRFAALNFMPAAPSESEPATAGETAAEEAA